MVLHVVSDRWLACWDICNHLTVGYGWDDPGACLADRQGSQIAVPGPNIYTTREALSSLCVVGLTTACWIGKLRSQNELPQGKFSVSPVGVAPRL